jgi:hypothetical protein
MNFAVSFYVTRNLNKLSKHWVVNSKLKDRGILGTHKTFSKKQSLGGIIAELEWVENKDIRIVNYRKLIRPSGFDYDFRQKIFYVASLDGNFVYLLDRKFKEIGKISNNLMNDIHSVLLSKSSDKLLVVSTGVDLIMETDLEGNVVWQWWAIDNGYNLNQFGEQCSIEKHVDHRKLSYPTLKQTCHINSAIYFENKILASLFHQGCIIEIEVESMKTRQIARNLSHPHSLSKIDNKTVLFANTGNSSVISLDIKSNIVLELKGEFDWLQDCIKVSNGNYLIADSNNNRIVEISGITFRHIREFRYNSFWKIFHLKEIL